MARFGRFGMNEEDEAFEDLAKRQGDWGMQGSRKHQILRYAENVENKGTSMTDKKAMAMALEALETLMIERESIYEKSIAALKERLSDPMREVQRLGQEIEQERNFCPRCGKRTKDLITIHTCTPPQENT